MTMPQSKYSLFGNGFPQIGFYSWVRYFRIMVGQSSNCDHAAIFMDGNIELIHLAKCNNWSLPLLLHFQAPSSCKLWCVLSDVQKWSCTEPLKKIVQELPKYQYDSLRSVNIGHDLIFQAISRKNVGPESLQFIPKYYHFHQVSTMDIVKIL